MEILLFPKSAFFHWCCGCASHDLHHLQIQDPEQLSLLSSRVLGLSMDLANRENLLACRRLFCLPYFYPNPTSTRTGKSNVWVAQSFLTMFKRVDRKWIYEVDDKDTRPKSTTVRLHGADYFDLHRRMTLRYIHHNPRFVVSSGHEGEWWVDDMSGRRPTYLTLPIQPGVI